MAAEESTGGRRAGGEWRAAMTERGQCFRWLGPGAKRALGDGVGLGRGDGEGDSESEERRQSGQRREGCLQDGPQWNHVACAVTDLVMCALTD